MELPPPHVLAQLDALIVGQSIAAPSIEVEEDDDQSISSAAFGIGQLVPRARPAAGHGRDASRKRRREEPAAAAGKWNEHDVERELNNQEYRKKIQARIAEIERENAEREATAARND